MFIWAGSVAKVISEEKAKEIALEWASSAIKAINTEKNAGCKDPKVSSKAVYDEDLLIYDVVVEFWCRSIIFSSKYMYRLSIGANGEVKDSKYINEGVDF